MSAITGINWDNVQSTGQRLRAGFHQCRIVGFREIESSQKQTPGWEFKFEADSGSIPDTFWLTEKAYGRIKLLAEACGVRLSGAMTVTPKMFVGKTCWLCVIDKPYEDKKTGEMKDGTEVSPYSYRADEPEDVEKRAALEAAGGGR